MSIECGDCERDARSGHDKTCSRYKRYYTIPDPAHPSTVGHLLRTEEDDDVELGDDVWFTPAEAAVCAWALENWRKGRTLTVLIPPSEVTSGPRYAGYYCSDYDGPKP